MLGGGWDGVRVARGLRRFFRTSCPPLVLVSATLNELAPEDRAVFDAHYPKSAISTNLVDEIVKRAGSRRRVTSAPALRGSADETRRHDKAG